MDAQGPFDEQVVACEQVVELERWQRCVLLGAPVGDPAVSVAEQGDQVLGPAVYAGQGVELADPGCLARMWALQRAWVAVVKPS